MELGVTDYIEVSQKELDLIKYHRQELQKLCPTGKVPYVRGHKLKAPALVEKMDNQQAQENHDEITVMSGRVCRGGNCD